MAYNVMCIDVNTQ